MSDLIKTATALSQAFMPAERAQKDAALHASRSVTLALELSEHPEFSNGRAASAAVELARGAALSVEARFALESAHHKFARALTSTSLPESGWGCSGGVCAPDEPNGQIMPFERPKAA